MKAGAILKAREERGLAIEKLEKIYSQAVISVTVNIPGGKKADRDYSWIGVLAFNEIIRQLPQEGIIYEKFRETCDGPEAIIVASGKAEELKRIAVDIEETHPLGRLFDIDISGFSRHNHGGKRACFICGGDANSCRRDGKHSIEDLMDRIDSMIGAWEASIVESAVESVMIAMKSEVDATPKPGLVDRDNNGAHTDMDHGTFIKSIRALKPYFREMAEVSVHCSASQHELFSELRLIGKRAEMAMLKATDGINTHKGQIFSLGLAVGAGCCLKRKGELSPESLSKMISSMAQGLSKTELKFKIESNTHGEKVFDTYGVTGIRGQAEKGFPAAFNVGLPAYEEAIAIGYDENRAMLKSLLAIMECLEDSNVYIRGGPYAATWVKKKSFELLEEERVSEDEELRAIREFDSDMISKNISPGGAADMLALTVFAYQFTKR